MFQIKFFFFFFLISGTDFDEFGATYWCFGCTESIADGGDWIRSQGHPLDVKVKQNDVKIPILFYKFSVSNCVIYCLFLKFVFAVCWIVVT